MFQVLVYKGFCLCTVKFNFYVWISKCCYLLHFYYHVILYNAIHPPVELSFSSGSWLCSFCTGFSYSGISDMQNALFWQPHLRIISDSMTLNKNVQKCFLLPPVSIQLLTNVTYHQRTMVCFVLLLYLCMYGDHLYKISNKSPSNFCYHPQG